MRIFSTRAFLYDLYLYFISFYRFICSLSESFPRWRSVHRLALFSRFHFRDFVFVVRDDTRPANKMKRGRPTRAEIVAEGKREEAREPREDSRDAFARGEYRVFEQANPHEMDRGGYRRAGVLSLN